MNFYEEKNLEGSIQRKHKQSIQAGLVLSEERGLETA